MSMPQASWPADTSAPVEVRFGTTRPQRRVTVFFRLILALPQLIVVGVVGYGAFVVVFLGWFAALFTGRLPASFARFLTGYVRWYARVLAYMYLMTDEYPPFGLDPDMTYPVDLTVTTGRLNRAAVLFRLVLAIPAYIVSVVLLYGWGVLSFFFWIITLAKGSMPDSIFGATAATIRYQARVSGYFYMVTSVYPGGLLGDTAPDGSRVDVQVSGTPYAPPPPPPPPLPPPPSPPPPPSGPWAPVPGPAPAPAPAWGTAPGGVSAPVTPPVFTSPPTGPPSVPPSPPPPLPPVPPLTGMEMPPPGAPTGSPTGAPTPRDAEGPTREDGGAGSPDPAPPSPPSLQPTPPSFPSNPPSVPPLPAPVGATILPPGATLAGPTAFDAGPGRVWPLLLSSAARTLTIVLLVVGAVAFVAYVALFGSSVRFSSSISASIESSIAAASTQAAYDALESPTNTFVSATKSCRANSVDVTDELQCLQSADRAFAGAIEGYQTSLSQIVYPSSAQVEADAAVAAARSVDAILHSLVTAPDAQSYTAISTGSAFTSSLHALDSTYNQLMTTLNG